MSRRLPVYRDLFVDCPTGGESDWAVFHARPLLAELLSALGEGWRTDPDPHGWFAWREVGAVVQEVEAEPAGIVPERLPDPLPLRVTARVTPRRAAPRLRDLLDAIRSPERSPEDDAFLDFFEAAACRCPTFSTPCGS